MFGEGLEQLLPISDFRISSPSGAWRVSLGVLQGDRSSLVGVGVGGGRGWEEVALLMGLSAGEDLAFFWGAGTTSDAEADGARGVQVSSLVLEEAPLLSFPNPELDAVPYILEGFFLAVVGDLTGVWRRLSCRRWRWSLWCCWCFPNVGNDRFLRSSLLWG